MQAVEYNLQLLSQINHVDGYNVTNVGVVNGCDSGNACNDTSHQNICPTNSYCNNTWRGHVCSCHSNTVPVGTECKNPCHPNPCVGGTCIHNRYQNSGIYTHLLAVCLPVFVCVFGHLKHTLSLSHSLSLSLSFPL